MFIEKMNYLIKCFYLKKTILFAIIFSIIKLKMVVYMNIRNELNSRLHHGAYFLNNQVIPTLSPLHKKILAVVSAILSVFVLYCLAVKTKQWISKKTEVMSSKKEIIKSKAKTHEADKKTVNITTNKNIDAKNADKSTKTLTIQTGIAKVEIIPENDQAESAKKEIDQKTLLEVAKGENRIPNAVIEVAKIDVVMTDDKVEVTIPKVIKKTDIEIAKDKFDSAKAEKDNAEAEVAKTKADIANAELKLKNNLAHAQAMKIKFMMESAQFDALADRDVIAQLNNKYDIKIIEATDYHDPQEAIKQAQLLNFKGESYLTEQYNGNKLVHNFLAVKSDNTIVGFYSGFEGVEDAFCSKDYCVIKEFRKDKKHFSKEKIEIRFHLQAMEKAKKLGCKFFNFFLKNHPLDQYEDYSSKVEFFQSLQNYNEEIVENKEYPHNGDYHAYIYYDIENFQYRKALETL